MPSSAGSALPVTVVGIAADGSAGLPERAGRGDDPLAWLRPRQIIDTHDGRNP